MKEGGGGGGGEGDAKAAEEKLKRLRKRNAELVALARQLDDKIKTLKLENEQLVGYNSTQYTHTHTLSIHTQAVNRGPEYFFVLLTRMWGGGQANAMSLTPVL